MTNDISHLPEPGVILDLDSIERPADEVKPPFIVKLGGRRIEFADPSDIDWQILASLEGPQDLFAVAMDREDRRFFREQKMAGWKFNRLMEAYYVHYDFEEKIRAAKRQGEFGL